ncbi:sugar kinase [Microbacterium faecale]|uniref:Sugar kinase n=1 Tax=Microbacterium faecale TaxID=1804630 RepID=A0A916Y1N8_9MICO|nr:ROK family protein [Microbacterium faecale]GGD26353.1 sugar kinase [Microbacterium faecale]
MGTGSTLRFAAQTDEVTSLLRIVNLVRTREAVTRPEIGRLTGLGRGVVTQRIDHAIDMGFLEDADLAPSTGGRSARTLRFRAERGRIIVCALGAQHIHVGITDLEGNIVDDTHVVWQIAQGPQATLERAIVLVDELVTQHGERDVWAVVVGLPGPVDFATGRPVAPPIMPGWNEFDVRAPFEERYEAPVWVDNDVNMLVLTEREGRRAPHEDMIYMKIGSGVGSALLSRGRLHRGANGSAGDIGHVRIAGAEEQCRCGKTGCLEAVAGGWALIRDAERAIADGATSVLADRVAAGEPLQPEHITLAVRDGDALALKLVQTSARVAGDALAVLVNMFNPKTIIIGGAIASAGEVMLAEVRQRIYELSLPLATRDLVIDTSRKDQSAPISGGAELAIEELFETTFPRWFADARPSPALTRV